MTHLEAIEIMKSGGNVRHRYFRPDEYMFMIHGKMFNNSGEDVNDFFEFHNTEGWLKDWSIVE